VKASNFTSPERERGVGASQAAPPRSRSGLVNGASLKKKLRLAASVLLLGWLAWQTNWDQVREAFGRLRLGPWLLAVAVYAVAQVVSSARWQLMARPLGFDAPLRRFLGLYWVGMFFNLVLPTSVGGDAVRAWQLGGPGRRLPALVSVLADRVSGLMVMLVMALTALLVCPPEVPAALSLLFWGAIGGLLAALALAPLAAWAWERRDTAEEAGDGPRWSRLLGRLRRLRQETLDALRLYLRRPRLLLVSTLLSLAVQAASVALVWLVATALGVAVPAGYWWVVAPVVSLLTLLPVSLNGMGVREGSLVLLLQPAGVDAGTALTLAFLWFAATAAVSLSGVVPYLFGSVRKAPSPVYSGERDFREVRADHEPERGDSDQGRAGQPRAAA